MADDPVTPEVLTNKVRDMRFWQIAHPFLDLGLALLPFGALLSLFSGVWFLIPTGFSSSFVRVALGSVVYGWALYSWVIYSIHECGAHTLKLPVLSSFPRMQKVARFVLRHTSRLFGADVSKYSEVHASHHAFLGTDLDRSNTHFVSSRQLFLSLIPFANAFGVPRIGVQPSPSLTFSRLVSLVLSVLVFLFQFWITRGIWNSLEFLAVFFFLGPWIARALDALRNTLEHSGMPVDRVRGTRELGLGFLGMLVGGGPWGQPCHLSHHLAPSLPWYQQLILSANLKHGVVAYEKI